MAKSYLILSLLILFAAKAVAQPDDEWYLFTSDRINLYVRDFGVGDTVLVVHGGFGAEHSYLVDALHPLANDYHFVFFDQRGSLRSPAPDSLLRYENIIADIESLRVELRIDKVNILAHSMGTRLAMDYACRYPENVRTLLLISSVLPRSQRHVLVDSATRYLSSRPAVRDVRMQVLPDDKSEWLAKHKTYDWRISFAAVNLYCVEKWRQMKGGVSFYNQHSANLLYSSAPQKWDFVEPLDRGNVRMVVVNGTYDYLNFSAVDFAGRADSAGYTWKDFKGAIKGLSLIEIDEAGHRPWIDKPDQFKEVVRKSL